MLKDQKEIKALTSIRGIAAMLVMVYHFHPFDNASDGYVATFISKSYLWVDLFFVLSGFVMAMTYYNMFSVQYSWDKHKEFLLRRLARIYPLYAFVTIVVSLYSLIIYRGYANVHRPAVHLEHPVIANITNLLMVQAWGFGESIGGPTWSISTEWAAYILFPFLMYLTIFSRRWGAFLVAGLAAAALLYIASTPETGQENRNGPLDVYHGFDGLLILRCLSGFCFGLLTFRVAKLSERTPLVYTDWFGFCIILMLVGAMACGVDDLRMYPLFPFLVLALYGNRGVVSRLFSARVPYTLGILSYSIYLLHFHFAVLSDQLRKHLELHLSHAAAVFIAISATCLLVVGCSLLSYNFIEMPGRKWLRKISG